MIIIIYIDSVYFLDGLHCFHSIAMATLLIISDVIDIFNMRSLLMGLINLSQLKLKSQLPL